jgi:hypothetical protein
LIEYEGEIEPISAVVLDIGEEVEEGEKVVVGLLEVGVGG